MLIVQEKQAPVLTAIAQAAPSAAAAAPCAPRAAGEVQEAVETELCQLMKKLVLFPNLE